MCTIIRIQGGFQASPPDFLREYYMKCATTIQEQIQLLKKRGMIIEDEGKARDVLLDIGYYRLGFYWFPFEKSYPAKERRTHHFKKGASFKKAVDLYYFDSELRSLLSPYLHRIEINLRTFVIYTVSNRYKTEPTWFADSRIVKQEFINNLPDTYATIKRNSVISLHHSRHINDIYAPAWKTLEYMTFGDILMLIQSLKDENLQAEIANHYGLRNLKIFFRFMNTVRVARNLCAHGHNMYDLSLQVSIRRGPIKYPVTGDMTHNICGVLLVVFYFLSYISPNREKELRGRLKSLILSQEYRNLQDVIGFILDVL